MFFAIITPIKPFEIVKTTIAKIVIHNAGSMMNTSPYLSNSFPEIGLTMQLHIQESSRVYMN